MRQRRVERTPLVPDRRLIALLSVRHAQDKMSQGADHDAPERGPEAEKAHARSSGYKGDERRFPMLFILYERNQVRQRSAEQCETRKHRHEALRKRGKKENDCPRKGATEQMKTPLAIAAM